MKAIKIRMYCLAAANSLVSILTIILIFKEVFVSMMYVGPVLISAVISFLALFGLLLRECGRYKSAKLIMENEIMHIQVAKIEDESFKSSNGLLLVDGIDAYISCFGIMLGSKVIKFNTDGIALKSIGIGRKFISFVYGVNGKDKTLRILHGVISQQEMQGFIERISYETGVSPLVTD